MLLYLVAGHGADPTAMWIYRSRHCLRHTEEASLYIAFRYTEEITLFGLLQPTNLNNYELTMAPTNDYSRLQATPIGSLQPPVEGLQQIPYGLPRYPAIFYCRTEMVLNFLSNVWSAIVSMHSSYRSIATTSSPLPAS